ncbi:hypothetical protein M3Y94_00997300 [Aphelenchoides besseyi]|nr:hypothetical protein M3Y94_00997300 [Aphelenchoides besseyi]
MRNQQLQSGFKKMVSELASSPFAQGGFETKMTRGEASRILGVSTTARTQKNQRSSQKADGHQSSRSWWFSVFGRKDQRSQRSSGEHEILSSIIQLLI